MLENVPAFSGFSVNDLDEAEAFYGQKLGLKVTRDGAMDMLSLHIAGGNPIMVYVKPNHVPATYTILNFPVDTVEATVDELTAKGVLFEHYEGFDQDEKGIARSNNGPTIAWFADPSGNILSVLEKR